ncbi:MAG: hypothetical protein ABI879_01490 [Actinomycetota bacterium]
MKNQSSPTAPVGSPGQFGPIRGIASNPKVELAWDAELGREVGFGDDLDVHVVRALPNVAGRRDEVSRAAAPLRTITGTGEP